MAWVGEALQENLNDLEDTLGEDTLESEVSRSTVSEVIIDLSSSCDGSSEVKKEVEPRRKAELSSKVKISMKALKLRLPDGRRVELSSEILRKYRCEDLSSRIEEGLLRRGLETKGDREEEDEEGLVTVEDEELGLLCLELSGEKTLETVTDISKVATRYDSMVMSCLKWRLPLEVIHLPIRLWTDDRWTDLHSFKVLDLESRRKMHLYPSYIWFNDSVHKLQVGHRLVVAYDDKPPPWNPDIVTYCPNYLHSMKMIDASASGLDNTENGSTVRFSSLDIAELTDKSPILAYRFEEFGLVIIGLETKTVYIRVRSQQLPACQCSPLPAQQCQCHCQSAGDFLTYQMEPGFIFTVCQEYPSMVALEEANDGGGGGDDDQRLDGFRPRLILLNEDVGLKLWKINDNFLIDRVNGYRAFPTAAFLSGRESHGGLFLEPEAWKCSHPRLQSTVYSSEDFPHDVQCIRFYRWGMLAMRKAVQTLMGIIVISDPQTIRTMGGTSVIYLNLKPTNPYILKNIPRPQIDIIVNHDLSSVYLLLCGQLTSQPILTNSVEINFHITQDLKQQPQAHLLNLHINHGAPTTNLNLRTIDMNHTFFPHNAIYYQSKAFKF